MNKICGECAHYLHGQLENPCAKGNRFVGYLLENKVCWESKEGESDEATATKVCAKCGKELSVKMFYKTKLTPDHLTNVCKLCKPHHWYKEKAKRKRL